MYIGLDTYVDTCCPNLTKNVPKPTKHSPNIVPKCTQNERKMVAKRFQNRGRSRLTMKPSYTAKSFTATPQTFCVFELVLGAIWDSFGCHFSCKVMFTCKNSFWSDFEPSSSSKLAPIWVPNWFQDCEHVLMMLKNKNLKTHRYFLMFLKIFGMQHVRQNASNFIKNRCRNRVYKEMQL